MRPSISMITLFFAIALLAGAVAPTMADDPTLLNAEKWCPHLQ